MKNLKLLNLTLFYFLSILSLSAQGQNEHSSSFYTNKHQVKALELYKASIAYKTVAGQGQVPAYAKYLAEEFIKGGFPEKDVHVLPFTLPSGEETAGLVVRYNGNGSSGKKPILLTGHMDVVDAKPEDWELNPFVLTEKDGYFFGRGTFDDKAGVVMLTSVFLRLKSEGFIPNRDLIIVFTGDEESGMVTTKGLVNEYRHLTDAEYALNADAGGGVLDNETGQPMVYFVQNAEKTFASFDITVRNPGGHSSMPRTDNAIYELADVLKKIEAYRFPVQYNEATLAYFGKMAEFTTGEVSEAMARFAKNPNDEWAAEVLWNKPEYVGITRTTCVATMLKGGHAENALPQSATATVNCRIFPGVDVEEVRAKLIEVADRPGVEVTLKTQVSKNPPSPLIDEVMDAIQKTVNTRYPKIQVIPYQAPYGTDGKEFRAAGIPTYGTFGNFMKPSDNFAHGLNERMPVKEFYSGLDHWYELLTRLSGGKVKKRSASK